MKLGERFPPDEQQAFARRSLKPGAILYLFCSFTTPPKNKFVVVACIDPQPVLFLVNSEIGRWYQQRPHLRDCQITLQRSDHDFLRHDSFVDCTEARRSISLQEIERQISIDLNRVKGRVTEGEREAILYAIRVGKTIEQRVKDWIATSLGSEYSENE